MLQQFEKLCNYSQKSKNTKHSEKALEIKKLKTVLTLFNNGAHRTVR